MTYILLIVLIIANYIAYLYNNTSIMLPIINVLAFFIASILIKDNKEEMDNKEENDIIYSYGFKYGYDTGARVTMYSDENQEKIRENIGSVEICKNIGSIEHTILHGRKAGTTVVHTFSYDTNTITCMNKSYELVAYPYNNKLYYEYKEDKQLLLENGWSTLTDMNNNVALIHSNSRSSPGWFDEFCPDSLAKDSILVKMILENNYTFDELSERVELLTGIPLSESYSNTKLIVSWVPKNVPITIISNKGLETLMYENMNNENVTFRNIILT
jgi:hypothetical protein